MPTLTKPVGCRSDWPSTARFVEPPLPSRKLIPYSRNADENTLKQKILDRGLHRLGIRPRQVQQDVRRNADQFERHEQGNEIVRAGDQIQPGDDEQQAGQVLGRVLFVEPLPDENQ